MTEHNITLSDLEGLDLQDFDPAEYDNEVYSAAEEEDFNPEGGS